MKYLYLISVVVILVSCEQENTPLSFNEKHVENSEDAIIEINYPIATGNKKVSEKINNSLETTIAMEMSLSEEIFPENMDEAVESFAKEFRAFKKDFPETEQKWEALVDSEVVYHSSEIISISLSTYIDTGGAHGNTHIVFLNFDPETGEEFTMEELIKDEEGFRELAIKYFKKHLETKQHDLDVVDSFYGKDFQLPETIGYSEEGIIILYNIYEIAAYSFGITEFEIPYEEVSKYLNKL